MMRREGPLLTVGRGRLRKVGAKGGRLGQPWGGTWRALAACQLSRQTLRLGWFLRRRSKRRAALIGAAGHDAAEVVGRAVANLGRRRRLVAAHGRMAAAGNIQLSAQSSDFGFVSG